GQLVRRLSSAFLVFSYDNTLLFMLFKYSREMVRGCKVNWKEFMGSCYLFSPERASWMDAELRCQELDSHLVSIASQQEQDFVSCEYAAWVFVPGRLCVTPLRYQNWRPNQPDYLNPGEDCVVMIWHEGGQWDDIPCNYHLPFICKSRLGINFSLSRGKLLCYS
uniref:C-type lectin domain-containing protein n=1 Tax=Denticeps clupeoides TaxID=299321 RepID=A0AAY4B3W4_9TELE